MDHPFCRAKYASFGIVTVLMLSAMVASWHPTGATLAEGRSGIWCCRANQPCIPTLDPRARSKKSLTEANSLQQKRTVFNRSEQSSTETNTQKQFLTEQSVFNRNNLQQKQSSTETNRLQQKQIIYNGKKPSSTETNKQKQFSTEINCLEQKQSWTETNRLEQKQS